jgi:phosphate transport system permease protein
MGIFLASTIFGIVVLATLLFTILNQSFGLAAIEDTIPPESLAVDGVALDDLSHSSLVTILQNNVSEGLFRRFEYEQAMEQRSRDDLLRLIYERVVEPVVQKTYTLTESLFNRSEIEAQVTEAYPEAYLRFMSWIHPQFISRPQSAHPLRAGVRTAIFGSLWTVAITILFAFPIGVGAAIYLEEYATDSWLNRLLQTNINNLAGVPSIIYGILGLAVFVRALEPITSGAIFGAVADTTTANGRTILSAGLTLGLLILPLIIINAREAIRAVPNSLRRASYGLGATKWQTVWHHVLPSAISGIMTGTILAVSRALGETAPLVVVGASTFITFDPTSPFSKFSTLPIQIYQWTARPQAEFRNIAAAAILVLLALLITLNTAAVLFRNRAQQRQA